MKNMSLIQWAFGLSIAARQPCEDLAVPWLHTLTHHSNRSPYDRWHAEAAAGLPRVTLALADLPADRQELLEQVTQAQALGYQVKVALPGPLSLLWQVPDALERLSATLDRYDALLLALADAGVDWVQLDEPLLLQHLPQPWGAAFEGAYNRLQRVPLQLLLACPGGLLHESLGLACSLPVDGLHVDLLDGERQLVPLLDRLPAYKVLSLGVVDSQGRPALDSAALTPMLANLHGRLRSRLWLADSRLEFAASALARSALAALAQLRSQIRSQVGGSAAYTA